VLALIERFGQGPCSARDRRLHVRIGFHAIMPVTV
jgi:hypothetical protein